MLKLVERPTRQVNARNQRYGRPTNIKSGPHAKARDRSVRWTGRSLSEAVRAHLRRGGSMAVPYVGLGLGTDLRPLYQRGYPLGT